MQKRCLSALIAAVVLSGCGGGNDSDSAAASKGQDAAVIVNVSDYGAKGDGTTNDTVAIQKALDAASAAKGTVVFPQGVFMVGALFVKSNTTVQVDEGVTLKAIQADTQWAVKTAFGSDGLSANATGNSLYPQVNTRVQGIEMNWVSAVINVRYAENVTITGKGTIDGQGQTWWDHYYGAGTSDHKSAGVTWALNYDEQRPRALETFESKNVTIKDVTIQNSPFWTLHICYTDKAHIDGVKVYNLMNAGGHMPSTDGIDIDSSTNVLVENADVTANDDAFVIKSGRDGDGVRVARPTANVVIRNSVVQAGAAGFTIGSETSGGAHDIEVSNIHVKPLVAQYSSNIGYAKGGPTVYSGFIFKSAPTRGGVMENVNIHDIVIDDAYFFFRAEESWGSSTPIPATFGTTYAKPSYWDAIIAVPTPADLGYPIFRNFKFKNVTINNLENQAFYVVGTTLAGEVEKGQFTNFSFDNVHVNSVNMAGASKSAGSIKNASGWAFTNSTMVDAAGGNIAPTLDAATTSNMKGLIGW